MNTRWIPITQLEQLDEIGSNPGLSLIFKHSTQCPVSSMVKKTFEMEWDAIPHFVSLYYLDLIRYRNISQEIADKFKVKHESPQVILFASGKILFHTSHSDISAGHIGSLVHQEI